MIPSSQENALHRAPRPLIGWLAVLLGAGLVAFISVVLFSMARAFLLTAAQGHPVPDVTGGLGNLAALITAICAALWQALQFMQNRHLERRDEIAYGSQSVAPFVSSPSLSPGPSEAPRPGDSQ